MRNLLQNIPARLKGPIIDRQEPCTICGSIEGKKLAEIGFWDIRECDLIQCEYCGLIQLDPMLTSPDTARGCLAYYQEGLRKNARRGAQEGRNNLRNFRRGFLFGRSLQRLGFSPGNTLELGPGSGYFAEGVKFAFPQMTVTMLDVNEKVLLAIEKNHGNHTIATPLETAIPALENQFDLIIARDVLEHVIDVAAVINNVRRYAKPQGLFHFTVPNGHEDVWKHYLTYRYRQARSELLLNHVNYFDGKGLLEFLQGQKFQPIKYYTYKFKTTLRGRGWKVREHLMAPICRNKSSAGYNEEDTERLKQYFPAKQNILDKWYIHPRRKLFTLLISWYHHAHILRMPPEFNLGHEIFGLFRVDKSK
jgi:2-polyprenyl-3-methyl-5-hydroxy-6-metoxy-1,4-benzoquinol methylase